MLHWIASRDFLSLIDGPEELVDSLGPHLPEFEPIVEDLTKRSDDELFEMKATALLRLMLMLMKHSRDRDLIERLPKWKVAFAQAYHGSGFDALVRVLMYIMEVVDGATLEKLEWVDAEIDASEGEMIMTLAEKLRQEGRQQGLEQGREQGLEQGLEQGQRALLQKLLHLKFGELSDEALTRFQSSSLAELETMAERVLTAESLDEVLGGGS